MALWTDMNSPTHRSVVVQNPAAGVWTVHIAGASDLGSINLFAGVPSDTPVVNITSLAGGAMRSDVNIAYTATDADSDARVTFYYDADGSGNNGVRIGGVTESDGSGTFVWDAANVPPGTYHVYAVIDDGVNAPQFVYSAGTVAVTAPGIAGSVWHDTNANGLRDVGELAAGGTPVFIDLDQSGSHDANEPLYVTSESGAYHFHDLALGDYKVRVLPKPGFVPSAPAAGLINVALAAAELETGHDFGLRQTPASISGLAWRDQDRDGFRDSTEPLLSNIAVTLTDVFGNLAGATVTDFTGAYSFASLVPGHYRVTFAPPAGHVATARLEPGKSDSDSDISANPTSSLLLSLAAGDIRTDIDAGLFHPFQSPRHRLDVDADGNITPLDALLIIIHLNASGGGPPAPGLAAPPYVDVDADNVIAPLDALLVLTHLNVSTSGEAEPLTPQADPAPFTPPAVDWYYYHYGQPRPSDKDKDETRSG
jgi:hypothetical protein